MDFREKNHTNFQVVGLSHYLYFLFTVVIIFIIY